jgi:hypothetical protein
MKMVKFYIGKNYITFFFFYLRRLLMFLLYQRMLRDYCNFYSSQMQKFAAYALQKK